MSNDGIEAFWAWWPEAGARLLDAINDRRIDEAQIAEISAKVQGIDPKLTWELGPGVTAQHAFCLSPAGDPELRRLTERWLRAAPAANAVWEFHPAGRGSPGFADAELQIAEHSVALADMRFTVAIDENRELMNVICFHPVFAALPEEMRGMTTFIAINRVLGEDTVQRWLGGINTTVDALAQGAPFATLLEAVGSLSRDATGERFTSLRGETPDGRPMVATMNLALKRIDHLACDTHLSVDVALLSPDADGMPDRDEAEALGRLEDELKQMITGDAAYFGRETLDGRRVLHWFVAADHPVRPTVEDWAARHADRDVRLTWTADPHWASADRFG
jgi:hypothetical protein